MLFRIIFPFTNFTFHQLIEETKLGVIHEHFEIYI